MSCPGGTEVSRTRLACMCGSIGCVLLALLSVGRAVPPDHNDDALRKMCEHGLAAVAADYCRTQAALSSEDAARRSRWTMRQMECQCQAALANRADDDRSWEAVAGAEAEYRREFPDDARLPWLAWQLARADLLRSQQALAKWLATSAAVKQREAALQAVRRLLSRLDEVEAAIKQRLPLSDPRNSASRTQAPSSELHALAVDCTLLRCEGLLVRAKSYPSSSPDRLAALADVDRIAGEMLLRAPQDWPARDELWVARATAGLEVGKRAASIKILTNILNERPGEVAADQATTNPSTEPTSPMAELGTRQPQLPSPRARIRAGSTLVEALCIDKDISGATRALRTLEENFTGPEVALARIVVQLSQVETLTAAERAAQLKDVVDRSQQLGQQYGGYWRSRAEALLVGSAHSGSAQSGAEHGGSAQSGSELGSRDALLAKELVAVEVRQLLAGGQTAAAVAKLRTASENARAAGRPAEGLEFAFQAAALLQREQDWLVAADLLIPAALASPESSSAAPAHALAAWCLAQALRTDPSSAELQKRYETTLREQLARWPDADESSQAEEFLSHWLTGTKRFADLASMWRLRAESAGQPERKERALRQWLDTTLSKLPLNQAPAEQDELVAAIREAHFAKLERTATVAALASVMLTAPLTRAEAEELTGLKLPAHLADENIAEQALLSGLFTLAAARRGDATAGLGALRMLPLEQLTRTVMLAWTKSMVEAIDELPANQVAAWSEVANLIPLPKVDAGPLTPAMNMTELRLRMIRGGEGEVPVLLEEMKKLVDQNPRDARLQLSYAAAVAQNHPEKFNEAVAILKRVALGSSKDSDAYLRSRWLEIRWRSGRGDHAAAAQIAALTLASHAITTPWWKARFEANANPR